MIDNKQSLISRARRNFIRGRLTAHVASLLVQARPERMNDVTAELTAIPGVEAHGPAGPGKLIVTVETDDDAGLMAVIDRIQATRGVITASLVYHQIDEGGAA